MSKHTPGPWEIDDIGNVSSTAVHNIATVFCAVTREGWSGSDYATFSHCKANARLIAAAPDLAFHLLAASNYIDALGGDSKSYRAAIVKATGEQT